MSAANSSMMHNVLVMILADGKVSEEEKTYIERLRERLGITEEQFKELVKEVRAGARQIRLPGSPSEAQEALRELVEVCLADGQIGPAEHRVLEKVARHLGLSNAALDQMLDESGGSHEQEIQEKVEEIYTSFNAWSPDERRRHVAGLERFGRAAVMPLLQMLESYRAPDGAADVLELKVYIIESLAALGDTRAIYYLSTQVALLETSEVSNDDVRFAAAEAIGRLVGKPFTRDPAGVTAAAQWWKAQGMKDFNTLSL